MATLRIGSIDPALENWGMSLFNFDTETFELDLLDLKLVKTEPLKEKGVRKNSDDLRRAAEIRDKWKPFHDGCDLIFSEVPTGSQHARASFANGLVVGMLTFAPAVLIQILPLETKMASIGKKDASKQQIIDWAVAKYPTAPWLRARGNPNGAIIKDNEHLADSVAVAHAGLLTQEFGRLMMWSKRAA